MKPTFALDFRDGLVTLLHRTSRGWSLVGSAAFGAADFDETLAYLRSTALGLQPRGITTKLILPNDQILYTEVDVGASDGSRRRRLIRLALEGKTPYAVDDLVWDWSGEGSTVKVAVIARETLAEAEAFATEHRFNPVSFVSVPEAGQFEGEPFFGPTTLAPQVLGEADKVERDAEPVVILREAPKPEPGPAITEADLAPPVQDARDIEAEAEAAEQALAAQTAAEEVPEALLAPVAPEAETTASSVLPEPEPEPAPEAASEDMAEPEALPVEEAPMAVDVVADPAVEDDLPPAPAAAISAAFSSRKGIDRVMDAEPKPIGGALRAAKVEPAPPVSRPMPAKAEALADQPADLAAPEVTRPDLARPSPKAAVKEAGKGETLAFPVKGKGKGKALGVTAPTLAGGSRRDKVVTLPSKAKAAESAEKAAERPAPVIKGRPQIGGKPRYLGLILTVALLVLLAAVAVWSSFFMGTAEITEPSSAVEPLNGPQTEEAPREDSASLDTGSDPVTDALQTADESLAAETAPEAAGSEAGGSLGTKAETAAAQPERAPTAGTETAGTETADANTAGAVTAGMGASGAETSGAAETQVAPLSAPVTAGVVGAASLPEAVTPGPDRAIALASVDAPPGVGAPQVLAPLAAGVDPSPAAPPAPPPFGTVYKFDANGLIEPTPEGIMTPEGVLLVAGKPGLVPPPRPAELTVAAAPPTDASSPTPDAAALPTGTQTVATGAPGSLANPATPAAEPAPFADPSLEGLRPAARPAELVQDDPIQDGALPLPVDPDLAAARPQPRPEGLTPPEAAPEETALASLAPNNASLAATGAPLLTAPVTRAPRPPVKPTNLDRAVDDAVTAALDQPPAEEALELDEPELDTAAPNLPTRASVAKQATVQNAINTRKVALLAVYGTSSNRFAMIRQPNGAVKKVRIGDAIDGGTVNAITANSIEYQKGGRMVTLAMPTG